MFTSETIYIDTRPGSVGAFAPAEKVEDYAGWLSARIDEAHVKDGQQVMYYGVAQKVNQIVMAARHGVAVRAFGCYAGEAALMIEGLVGAPFEVEVLA